MSCVTETRIESFDRSGSVEGRVTLEGPVPRSWQVAEDTGIWAGARSAPPPGWEGIPPGAIGVTPTGGVRGVAVWLEPAESALTDGGRNGADVKQDTLTFRLQGSCFWPMIAVLPAGGTVRFENADARSHHVQFLSDGEARNVFVETGSIAEVGIDEPGRYRLTCNDHAFMRADLVVAPSPWSAVTDGRGRFLIEEVPSGAYEVRFAHHRLAEFDPPPVVVIGGGGEGFADLRAQPGRWKY